jgi:hypothetical protein
LARCGCLDGGFPWLGGGIRPNRQFVTAGFDEMKSPAAGKGKERFADFAAGKFDFCQRLL